MQTFKTHSHGYIIMPLNFPPHQIVADTYCGLFRPRHMNTYILVSPGRPIMLFMRPLIDG